MSEKNKPEIRFRGFEGEWEKYAFSQILLPKARIGWQGLTKNEYLDAGDYYLITGTDFNNGQIDFSTCHYVDKFRYDQDLNIQVENGDLLIKKDVSIVNVSYFSNMVKPATFYYGVFVVRCNGFKEIDNLYLYQHLAGPSLLNYANLQATGGTIKHLNQNVLVNFPVPLPSFSEQKRIGSFFSALDRLIDRQRRKLEKLQTFKQAMLEKMFPKEGSLVPEIRFRGFQGEWEESILGRIIETEAFKPYLKEPSNVGNYTVVQQGNEPIAGFANGKPYKNFEKVVLFGDHTLSLYKPKEPFFVASDGLKILLSQKVDGSFLYCVLERYKPNSEGYKRHFTILQDQLSYYPLNDFEQKRIGSFFSTLDRLIDCQQRKLSKLQTLKQSLLQKMFV